MGVIRRAVERVNDPSVLRLHIMLAAFFRKNIVRWIMLFDFFDNQSFGLLVDFSDKVGFLPLFSFDMLNFSDVVFQNFPASSAASLATVSIWLASFVR